MTISGRAPERGEPRHQPQLGEGLHGDELQRPGIRAGTKALGGLVESGEGQPQLGEGLHGDELQRPGIRAGTKALGGLVESGEGVLDLHEERLSTRAQGETLRLAFEQLLPEVMLERPDTMGDGVEGGQDGGQRPWQVQGSKSSLWPGPGRSGAGRRRCSPTGREIPTPPNSTTKSAARSSESSKPSATRMTGCSKSMATCRPASSGSSS